MDLLELTDSSTLIHFMMKKSLKPVSELNPETNRILDLTGQQVLVGITDLTSENRRIREDSKRLVETTLPAVAPTVYRALNVATADYATHSIMVTNLGLSREDLPLVYMLDHKTGEPYMLMNSSLETNEVRKWAQDILKETLYS